MILSNHSLMVTSSHVYALNMGKRADNIYFNPHSLLVIGLPTFAVSLVDSIFFIFITRLKSICRSISYTGFTYSYTSHELNYSQVNRFPS